jgi:hypothetical protein
VENDIITFMHFYNQKKKLILIVAKTQNIINYIYSPTQMTYLTLTCYKSIAACQEHEEEKMGAGWGCTNPDRVPQGPQPNAVEKPEEAKPQKAVEKPEEAKPQEAVENKPPEKAPSKEESTNSPVRMQTSPYIFSVIFR